MEETITDIICYSSL